MKTLFFCLSVLLFACTDQQKPVETDRKVVLTSEFKQEVVNANKHYVKKESDMIDQYVMSHQLDVQKTETGLRFKISGEGKGEAAKPGQLAKVKYKVKLLDGTLCYSSESDGPKEFTVSADHIESGLHEGIQFMKVGQKGFFILPSHLAHGIAGDKNKIPPMSTLIFEIELLSLK